jgi:hypothetical protein
VSAKVVGTTVDQRTGKAEQDADDDKEREVTLSLAEGKT